MPAPSVTVVLIVLNESRYIAETIESILAQGYPGLELHVQDGGSTDGTQEILCRYPIRWASEQDNGYAEAMQRGIRATHGEILIQLGGDDPLVPGSIETLVEALIQHPGAGFVYGDVDFIDAAGHPFWRLKGRPFDLDALFWGNYIAPQSVAFRRSALVESNCYFREGLLMPDWDLYLRLGARYPSVYIPCLIGRYRVHNRSTTLNNFGRFAQGICRMVEDALQDPVVLRQLRHGPARARAGGYLAATPVFVLANDMRQAWKVYGQAVGAYPRALFTASGLRGLITLLLGPKLYPKVRLRANRRHRE